MNTVSHSPCYLPAPKLLLELPVISHPWDPKASFSEDFHQYELLSLSPHQTLIPTLSTQLWVVISVGSASHPNDQQFEGTGWVWHGVGAQNMFLQWTIDRRPLAPSPWLLAPVASTLAGSLGSPGPLCGERGAKHPDVAYLTSAPQAWEGGWLGLKTLPLWAGLKVLSPVPQAGPVGSSRHPCLYPWALRHPQPWWGGPLGPLKWSSWTSGPQ